MEDFILRGEYIKLCQLLKAVNLIDNGSDAKFEIQDGISVTNEETDILKMLITGRSALNDVNDVYIKSLNCKLKKTGSKATVKYILNEGYKLVFDNE